MFKKQLVLAFGLTALCGFAVTAHAETVESIFVSDGTDACPIQFTLVGDSQIYGVSATHQLRKKITVSILSTYMEKTDVATPVAAGTDVCDVAGTGVMEVTGFTVTTLP